MTDLSNVKVGDKLYIQCSRYDRCSIETVERITPTGRVITQRGTFERNGRMRGESSSWYSNYARPATEDDLANIFRYRLCTEIKDFRNWDEVGAEDLKLIHSIVMRHKK